MDKVNEAYWRGYHNGYACAMEDNAKLTIVRCKDCKYADWWGPKGREVLDCTHLYVPHVTPDWYCAWGERKE